MPFVLRTALTLTLVLTGALPAATAHAQADVDSLALRYAPTFHFHPEEERWPMTVEHFLANSRLLFLNRAQARPCDQQLAGYGKVRPSRLGVGPERNYKAKKRLRAVKRTKRGPKPIGACRSRGRQASASQYTRPFHRQRKRPPGIGVQHGFALDLHDKRRKGGLPQAVTPIYYLAGRTDHSGWYIRYFLMYGCSGVVYNVHACWHEGEWEGVTVVLGHDLSKPPVGVFYNQHHWGTFVQPWYNVVGTRDHPHVYVARTTHASYHYPGSFEKGGDETSDKGYKWTPARVTNVAEQPWYGFGGSWGDARSGGTRFPFKDRVGPLGPGHSVPGDGFPSPWAFGDRIHFPAGYKSWCDWAWYPDNCIRPKEEGHEELLDLACADLPFSEFRVARLYASGLALQTDPHVLDGDHDGIGCELDREREPLQAVQWGWNSESNLDETFVGIGIAAFRSRGVSDRLRRIEVEAGHNCGGTGWEAVEVPLAEDGSFASALTYLGGTPATGGIAGQLDRASATGNITGTISLQLPESAECPADQTGEIVTPFTLEPTATCSPSDEWCGDWDAPGYCPSVSPCEQGAFGAATRAAASPARRRGS